MLAANRCERRFGDGFATHSNLSPIPSLPTRFPPDEIRTGKNYYTASQGYAQGDRFRTMVYHGPDGMPRVAYTVMKNMPHGAIREQSRAAWEFLRHFRRPEGSGRVEYLPD